MIHKRVLKLIAISAVIYALWLFSIWQQDVHSYDEVATSSRLTGKGLEHDDETVTVHIGAVSWGKKYAEIVLQLIKTSLVLTSANIQWYVFTIDNATEIILQDIETWPDDFKHRVSIVKVPMNCWKWLEYTNAPRVRGSSLKPCVWCGIENFGIQQQTDRLIFVDLDIMITDDIVNLWNHFEIFTKDQIMAFSRADLRYIKLGFSDYSYDRRYGINSGVVLVHLKNMAGFNFEDEYIQSSKDKRYYENNETRDIGSHDDQNVLNVLFYKYPYKLRPLGCNWNFRGSMDKFCSPGHIYNCDEAIALGASLIHSYSDRFFVESHYAAVYNCTVDLDLYNIKDTVRCLRNGIKDFQAKRMKKCSLHINNLKPMENALNYLYG